MKKIIAILGLFIICQGAFAQSAQDSLAIVDAKWKTKKIKRGLVWKQSHYDALFGGQQEVNLLEVDLKKIKSGVSFRGSKDSLYATSKWLKDAAAGINGSFFDVKNGGGTTLLRIDGAVINHTEVLDSQGKNTERANAALILDGRQTRIVAGDNKVKRWDTHVVAKNVLVSGPLLLFNNEKVQLSKSTFNTNKHPRSVVAMSNDSKLVLAVMDGRHKQAVGMNLHELAFFMKIYGAKDALNLDGGGSSTLYIKGKGTNGVVNYPSDNKKFDHLGERKVANVIAIE